MNEINDPILDMQSVISDCAQALEAFNTTGDYTKLVWCTERSIPKLESLDRWARYEDFIDCLRTYKRWMAKEKNYNGHYYLIVKIEDIDWEGEWVIWRNEEEAYPTGKSAFKYFIKKFSAIREI